MKKQGYLTPSQVPSISNLNEQQIKIINDKINTLKTNEGFNLPNYHGTLYVVDDLLGPRRVVDSLGREIYRKEEKP